MALTHATRLVFAAIKQADGKKLSLAGLAQIAGTSRKTAALAVKALEQAGLIIVNREHGQKNSYSVVNRVAL